MRRTMLIGMLAVGAVFGAGCTAREEAAVREDVRGVREQIRGAAENAQQAAENAALAGKVKTALATRKGMDTSDINVEAKNGVVVLKGDVASRQQAEEAEKVAMGTTGVQAVDNQLMVRVPASSLPADRQPGATFTAPPATQPVPDTALPHGGR